MRVPKTQCPSPLLPPRARNSRKNPTGVMYSRWCNQVDNLYPNGSTKLLNTQPKKQLRDHKKKQKKPSDNMRDDKAYHAKRD